MVYNLKATLRRSRPVNIWIDAQDEVGDASRRVRLNGKAVFRCRSGYWCVKKSSRGHYLSGSKPVSSQAGHRGIEASCSCHPNLRLVAKYRGDAKGDG